VRIVELLGRRVAYILMNSYDPTTGLLTRPAFEKRANAMLTPATLRKDNCVIYVDIDRLHVMNENLGMHVGDQVIVRVAESIRQNLSPRMLAARISGDRFAMFVPETSVDATHDIADNLRRSFERLGFLRERQQVEVTASLGVANIVEGHQPLSHALASAEIACKAAKDRGATGSKRITTATRASRRYTDLTLIGTVARPCSASASARGADHSAAERRASDAEVRAAAARTTRRASRRGKILSAPERYQLAPTIDAGSRRTIEMLAPHAARLHEIQACLRCFSQLGDATSCSWTPCCATASCHAGCCRSRSPRRRPSRTSSGRRPSSAGCATSAATSRSTISVAGSVPSVT
jgi:diguanylate cyclase (GGDEF)-like protein